jgi:hypothetical protein
VSDYNTTERGDSPTSPSIEELIADLQPMGDLTRFAIQDLTAQEEDDFFAILEGA